MTFWNIDSQSSVVSLLPSLLRETGCDILVTAETGTLANAVSDALHLDVGTHVRHLTPAGRDVHVWSLLGKTKIRAVRSEQRFEAFRVKTSAQSPTLMVFAHLRSKAKRAAADEALDTAEFIATLNQMERKRWVAGRTVVAGDLNLHPYDESMKLPRLFNASASGATVAQKSAFRRRGHVHNRFYNPSWNLLGDANGPPGTFYWDADGLGGNWYCLDQVLLRPQLIPTFLLSSLRVITSIGGQALITLDGRPTSGGSDHMPVTFAVET